MWRWSRASKRYRDEDGKFLSRDTALEWVQQALDASGDVVAELSRLVYEDLLSPDDWLAGMRQEIKDEYIRQYLSAVGGRHMMESADWGRLGAMIKEQYGYLSGFYDDIVAGTLKEGQIRSRARMYTDSAREAYERGNAYAQGIPDGALPAYPGDGSTKCLVRCGCNWLITTVYNQDNTVSHFECFWTLNPALENCDDCQHRAEVLWNPFVYIPGRRRIRVRLADRGKLRELFDEVAVPSFDIGGGHRIVDSGVDYPYPTEVMVNAHSQN